MALQMRIRVLSALLMLPSLTYGQDPTVPSSCIQGICITKNSAKHTLSGRFKTALTNPQVADQQATKSSQKYLTPQIPKTPVTQETILRGTESGGGGGDGYIKVNNRELGVSSRGVHSLGLSPRKKARQVFFFDVEEKSRFQRHFMVYPYKALGNWNRPAQNSSSITNLCTSLQITPESPYCWALRNKIAEIGFTSPEFEKFLLKEMASYSWSLSEHIADFKDEGAIPKKMKKDMVQLAFRSGKKIQILKWALHGGFEDIEPLPYADFVALILHEVLYGAEPPGVLTSEITRNTVRHLFQQACSSPGKDEHLNGSKEMAWSCRIVNATGSFLQSKIISLEWKMLQMRREGRSAPSAQEILAIPNSLKPSAVPAEALQDLIRFSILNYFSIQRLLYGEKRYPLTAWLKKGAFEKFPEEKVFSQDDVSEIVNLLIFVNITTENRAGWTVWPNMEDIFSVGMGSFVDDLVLRKRLIR